MRILFHSGLTLKSYYKPILSATAQEFADMGKIIWKKTQNNDCFPKKYRNGKKFAKIINNENGDIFYKTTLGQYRLTGKGQNWIRNELFIHYLPKNTTIGEFMKTIISKKNHLKRYPNNLYQPPF